MSAVHTAVNVGTQLQGAQHDDSKISLKVVFRAMDECAAEIDWSGASKVDKLFTEHTFLSAAFLSINTVWRAGVSVQEHQRQQDW